VNREDDTDKVQRKPVAIDAGDYDTLGGLFIAQLGRVPTVGDKFEWNNLRFEVVNMDGHRVDKALIMLITRDGALSNRVVLAWHR
jgi:CBS domain containing-hemolysin-like protein